MDEFDANITPSDENDETQLGDATQPVDGPSRRTFLKAAVVGSAAAAAAFTAASVGASTLVANNAGVKSFKPFIGTNATISGVTGDACTTNTGGQDNNTLTGQTTFNKNESIYFWAKFNNVPAGTYVIDVAPTIPITNCVDYQTPTGAVKLYEYTAGTTAFTCNPAQLSDLPTASMTANSVPVTFTLGSASDVLLQIHLQGDNSSGNPVQATLAATLYQNSESLANVVDTATASQITVNG